MDNDIENFSCGFFKRSLNFSVANIRYDETCNESNPFNPVIDYLERGYPTRPTYYLEDLIKEVRPDFSWSSLERNDPINLKPFSPNWDNTIKGFDETDCFPARTFFNELIDRHIPKYSFIKNLIVPECKFGNIVSSTPQDFNFSEDWEADFFLSAANLVIEIDGPQHNTQTQKAIDGKRTNVLKKHSIRTHRIETWRINENSDSIKNYFKSLEAILKASNEIQTIRSSVGIKTFEQKNVCWDLIAIARLQRVLPEILSNPPEKKDQIVSIEIRQDFHSTLDWVSLAIKDFLRTFELLSFHKAQRVKMPKLKVTCVSEFSNSPNSLKLDISIFSHFDDTELNPNITYVKNSLLNDIFIESSKQSEKRPKINKFKNTNNFKINTSRKSLKQNLRALNYTTFGIPDFRPGQFEIITASLTNEATLGLMPTGGGKSLCFQSIGAFESGCCVVVCPITALVRDHVAELNKFGFQETAEFISSELQGSARTFVQKKFDAGKLKFLFVSPEKFQQVEFRQSFKSNFENGLINRVVIDEVHCISEWGHEFRTSYLTLAQTIRSLAPTLPIMCLTATAAVKVIEDIKIEFNIPDECILYFMDRSRKELSFEVVATQNKANKLKEIIENSYKSGKVDELGAFVVFGQTVDTNPFSRGIDDIYSDLKNTFKKQTIACFSGKQPKNWKDNYPSFFSNINCDYKNNNTFDRYKQEVQKLFKKNQIDGIVATKAFGMGVNKPNIRLAVHYGMPASMEALYQEAGRAGRDQLPAYCVTLFAKERNLKSYVHDRKISLEQLRKIGDEIKNDKGDFSQHLYFLTSSNKTIAAELEECISELNKWREQSKSDAVIVNEPKAKDGKKTKRVKEKIIFRLKQLGFVKDWTVENFVAGIYRVLWKDQEIDQLSESIFKTISKYSGEQAELKEYTEKLANARSLSTEDCERELIRVLLEWNYNHFVYQRRQSLKNLYEACENFENNEIFKDKLENYFRTKKAFSTLPDLLNVSISEAVPEVSALLLTKSGNLRTKAQLTSLSASVLRFLESYQSNVSLNLLSGLLRLLQNDFENIDGRQRFESFLKELGPFSEAKQVLLSLIELIQKFGPEPKKHAYSCLLEYFPEPHLARTIIEDTYQDRAESIILNDMNKRLEALL